MNKIKVLISGDVASGKTTIGIIIRQKLRELLGEQNVQIVDQEHTELDLQNVENNLDAVLDTLKNRNTQVDIEMGKPHYVKMD